MPRLKTHRGAAKRFRTTKKGRLKRERAFRSHLLTTKPKDRKRRLRTDDFVSSEDTKRIKRLLPYGRE